MNSVAAEAAPTVFASAEAVLAAAGTKLGSGEWTTITQERIDKFADATDDHQWIHVDPVKAKAGPFGAPIAHGYLTLSLMAKFLPQLVSLPGLKMGVNYGTEKVRFPSAVKAGARIRPSGEVISAERTKDGGVQAVIRVTVEIEGEAKPACVADTISRYYF
jgi:acyl dehydratase